MYKVDVVESLLTTESKNSCILDLHKLLILCSKNYKKCSCFQGFQGKLITSAKETLDRVEQTRFAAKTEAEKLGHSVSGLANYMDPLANAAIGLASKTVNSRQQANILDQTKTVAESALQFMIAAREGGGNPKSTNTHRALDEQADGLKENLQVLIQNLEEAASSAGVVTSMVDSISKAMSKVRIASHAFKSLPTLHATDDNIASVASSLLYRDTR